ncbi:YafY family transcriptional regulator [bacterium]|jgi:predicted DNA-binding transcriptional regulator YafY|nr:YafY family transcriptional regulator [bacterium]
MRLERLLAIVIKLLKKKRLTTRELASEFGVSKRTIHRDLQTISLSNIPLVSKQGTNGGWEIMPDYLVDSRVLSADDLSHILSSLSSVQSGFSHPSISKTLDIISSLVPPEKSNDIYKKTNHIIIDSQPWGFKKIQDSLLSTIHKSICEETLISFDYENLKSEKTTREIEPMTLLMKATSWYIFGYCLNKKNYRLFRLSRLSNIQQSKTIFTRRNKTIQDMKQETPYSIKNLTEICFTFSEPIKRSIGDTFGLDSIIKQKNSTYKLTINLPENDWLYNFLLGLGEHINIVSPERIQKILKEKAKKIVRKY